MCFSADKSGMQAKDAAVAMTPENDNSVKKINNTKPVPKVKRMVQQY